MRYVSTRGQAPHVGFVDAVLGGLAPDGGLYVPQTWPQISAAEIVGFADKSYAETAARIMGAFADDEISRADLL
ncbi:MAG TPA: threonine synthase, partial [Anaerolineae bacterium]